VPQFVRLFAVVVMKGIHFGPQRLERGERAGSVFFRP
jgi:hypothetical protein